MPQHLGTNHQVCGCVREPCIFYGPNIIRGVIVVDIHRLDHEPSSG